jgi:hypothetical protein
MKAGFRPGLEVHFHSLSVLEAASRPVKSNCRGKGTSDARAHTPIQQVASPILTR